MNYKFCSECFHLGVWCKVKEDKIDCYYQCDNYDGDIYSCYFKTSIPKTETNKKFFYKVEMTEEQKLLFKNKLKEEKKDVNIPIPQSCPFFVEQELSNIELKKGKNK